jgi:hypothetical protein
MIWLIAKPWMNSKFEMSRTFGIAGNTTISVYDLNLGKSDVLQFEIVRLSWIITDKIILRRWNITRRSNNAGKNICTDKFRA